MKYVTFTDLERSSRKLRIITEAELQERIKYVERRRTALARLILFLRRAIRINN